MAIIRSKRETKFTVINNCVFERNNLSFAAMGMLGYLLEKPDNWSVNPIELAKATEGTAKKSGRDAVYALLDELMAKGFVTRIKYANGKVDYTVFDEPVTDNPYYGKDVLREIPITENPDTENPDTEKADVLTSTERTTSTKKEVVKTDGDKLPPKVTTSKKETCISDDFVLPDDWIDWAKEKRPELSTDDIHDLFESFKDHHLSKGSKFLDWKRAWQTWVRNDEKFHPVKQKPSDDDIFRGCVNYG